MTVRAGGAAMTGAKATGAGTAVCQAVATYGTSCMRELIIGGLGSCAAGCCRGAAAAMSDGGGSTTTGAIPKATGEGRRSARLAPHIAQPACVGRQALG